jgi:hypothetical protein
LDTFFRKRLVVFYIVDPKLIRSTLGRVNEEVAEGQMKKPNWGIVLRGDI